MAALKRDPHARYHSVLSQAPKLTDLNRVLILFHWWLYKLACISVSVISDPRCTVTTQTLSPILALPCKIVDGKPEKTDFHGGATFPEAIDGDTIDIPLETAKAQAQTILIIMGGFVSAWLFRIRAMTFCKRQDLVRWSQNLTLNSSAIERQTQSPSAEYDPYQSRYCCTLLPLSCSQGCTTARSSVLSPPPFSAIALCLLCAQVYALSNSHPFVWQFWWNLKISRFAMDINSSYRTMAVRAARVKTNVAFMWRGCYVLKQAGWPGGWDSFREETTISALSLAAAADLSQAPPRLCIDRQCWGSEETTIHRGCRYPGEIMAD